MSVTIIEKPGINGMKNLALEYSPAILSKRTGKAVFIEDLVHRVYADPSDAREAKYNRVMLEKVELIRQYREQQIEKGELSLYDMDESKDFVAFYRKLAMDRKSSKTNYTASFLFFSAFVDGKCRFEEVGVDLYVRYRDYLATLPVGSTGKKLSYGTAHGYFDQFRYVLREAFHKGYLSEDLHDCAENLHEKRIDRYYVTGDDWNLLQSVPCSREDVPRICQFILFTGLRYSEVRALKWEKVLFDDQGRVSISRTLQLTGRKELFFISNTAFSLMGPKKKSGLVFPEEVYGNHNRCLQKWASEAGLKTHITFESFRRNFMEPVSGGRQLTE